MKEFSSETKLKKNESLLSIEMLKSLVLFSLASIFILQLYMFLFTVPWKLQLPYSPILSCMLFCFCSYSLFRQSNPLNIKHLAFQLIQRSSSFYSHAETIKYKKILFLIKMKYELKFLFILIFLFCLCLCFSFCYVLNFNFIGRQWRKY